MGNKNFDDIPVSFISQDSPNADKISEETKINAYIPWVDISNFYTCIYLTAKQKL